MERASKNVTNSVSVVNRRKMSLDRMKNWADDLVNNPIGVNDDYGNLIVSLGLALEQPPQETHDSQQPGEDQPVQAVVEQSGANECRSKQGMTWLKHGSD